MPNIPNDGSDGPRGKRGAFPRSWLLLLLAVSVGVIGLGWARVDVEKEPTASKPTAAIPVQMATVEPRSIKITRMGLGTVLAWNTVTITSQVAGKILALPFDEGAIVQAGDVLVRIDPRPFQALLDETKAKKAQDEANLLAEQENLTRDQTLLTKGGFATQQTVDNERAQVDADKAMIADDEAAIQSAQLNLDFATIKAPFTGVVGLRNVDVDNVITTTTGIVTITQIEPIAVEFTLPQVDLGVVQAGAAETKPKVVALDQSGKNVLADGTLDAINNQVDPASGTIKLKARFDNKDHKLWPGVFVQARVVTNTDQNAIAVPSQAVQQGPNGPYVWTVSPDLVTNLQPVQIGAIQGDQTVIASGLSAGNRIVVAGQYRLTPGARVAEAPPPMTNK